MASNTPLSQKEERLLSALAHGSAILSGLGILIGVVLFVTQRERSKWVAFQALQAAVYQFIGMVVIVGMWIVWSIAHGLSYIPLFQSPEAFEESPPLFFFITLAAMAIPFAVMILWGLYGMLGALQTLRGRDFRYVVIGGLLNSKNG
jgi:uncharacterized Tic20 family protein